MTHRRGPPRLARPGLTLRVLAAVDEVPAGAWDALFAHEPELASPFVRHAFLDGPGAERLGRAARRLAGPPPHPLARRARWWPRRRPG